MLMADIRKDNEENRNDPDTQLMLRFIQGDEESFNRLFHNNSNRAYQIALRFLGNSEDAKDIVQESFIKVYSSKTKWKPKAKFITWFYKIITNQCFKRKRKDKNIIMVSLDALISDKNDEMLLQPTSPPQNNPDRIFEQKEIKSVIQAAIESLPETQRIALILHRYENLSYKEISETLGCTHAAVESILFRAKQTLRKRLEPYYKDFSQVSHELRIKNIGGG